MTLLSHLWREPLLLALTGLCGCASIQSDRFYALQALPATATVSNEAFATQVGLRITVPSMVDRNELVLKQIDTVRVLEHERWASPLTDQVTNILGQDLERQRADLLISTRHISQPGAPRFSVNVEIYDMALQANGSARIEVRWRTEEIDGTKSTVGRNTFTASGTATGGYERSVQALSQCILLLAERLAQELPKS